MDRPLTVSTGAPHGGGSSGHLDGYYGRRFHSHMPELRLEIRAMIAAVSANFSLLVPRKARDVRIEETPLETCQRYPVGERNTQVPPDQRLATRSAAEPKSER